MEDNIRELKRSAMKIETLLCDIYDELNIPKKICTVCKSEVRLFVPAGEKLRPNAKCPVCGSFERTRAWWSYYEKMGLFTEKASKINLLHFAPERPFWEKFQKDDKIDYYPVDIDKDFPGIRDVVDITDIKYNSEKFDYIICNHVLEHIPDEKKALMELERVLKKDGILFLTVPFSKAADTLENPEYNTDELRSKYYGQKDHVRYYGKDIEQRFSLFFQVEKVSPNENMDESELKKYGLSANETIWKCRK